MSKMGISTLQSYRGAQIFEAVGLNQEVIDQYFTWTPSRIEGIGLDVIAARSPAPARAGLSASAACPDDLDLDVGGQYQWRRGGEYHLTNPLTVAKLQQAVRESSAKTFEEFSRADQRAEPAAVHAARPAGVQARPPSAVPIEEVEPAKEIVKRFKTGAMSFGSISTRRTRTWPSP